MTSSKIKVGTRASVLAIAQTKIIIEKIKAYDSSLDIEIVPIKTVGDKILNKTLDKIGGKGLFIKELEVALLNSEIDIAVHSFKDMPMEHELILPIVAVSEREDPRDVFILPKGEKKINITKPIGSSSLRRKIELEQLFKNKNNLNESEFLKLYKNLEYMPKVMPIRGNIISRLEKLDSGEYGALVLAYAGLKRLGLEERVTAVFEINEMLPSSCQGVLAVQGRPNEEYPYLEYIHNKEVEETSMVEREFTKILEGGCSSPTASYAVLDGEFIVLSGMYVNEDFKVFKGKLRGKRAEGKKLARELAETLKAGKEVFA